jgi:hypothetical protein
MQGTYVWASGTWNFSCPKLNRTYFRNATPLWQDDLVLTFYAFIAVWI